MLPLDLHVLSLSLAFILSQDQTLRCVLLCCLFSLNKDTSTAGADPVLIINAFIGPPSSPARGSGGLHLSLGISTGDPRNPFLVSLLPVRFPHRKHVNDQRLPDTEDSLSVGRQKNRSTRNGVLVSRKAMQNYNRSATWQNLSACFFAENAILTIFYISRRMKGDGSGRIRGATHILYTHARETGDSFSKKFGRGCVDDAANRTVSGTVFQKKLCHMGIAVITGIVIAN